MLKVEDKGSSTLAAVGGRGGGGGVGGSGMLCHFLQLEGGWGGDKVVCFVISDGDWKILGHDRKSLIFLVHVSLQKRCTSLGDRYQRETLFAVVGVNWAADRNWQTKLLDKRKGIQLNLHHQENWQTKLLDKRKGIQLN